MDDICIFMNGARGLAVVDALLAKGHGLASVFIPAEMVESSELHQELSTLGVTPRPAKDINDREFIANMADLNPSLSVIAGYSELFRRRLIDTPKHGTINLHAGRLPKYRGGSPLNWQIINGEKSAGLSVLKVDEGIDTGNILAEAEIPIGSNETISDLHQRANAVFPSMTIETVNRMDTGTLQEHNQEEAQANYWHQRNDADGKIEWDKNSAEQIHDLVRAVTRPYPGAFTYLEGKRIRIFATQVPEIQIKGAPGRILWIQGRGPYVVCSDKALLVTDYASDPDAYCYLPHGAHLR